MKREKQLDDIRGTIQGEAVIEYVHLLQETIKNDVFKSEDTKVEDLIGSKIAIKYLDKLVRRLEKQETKTNLNNYE